VGIESIQRLCKYNTDSHACTLTWVCPLGTHRLVYQVRPIKEVDRHKDSRIDLETKKEKFNTQWRRTKIIKGRANPKMM
jgi:hypothetical protein